MELYIPKGLHLSLKWSIMDPLVCDSLDIDWKLVDRSKKSTDALQLTANHVVAQGSKPIVPTSLDHANAPIVVSLNSVVLSWDRNNWSCAYDSLFTMLFGIWNEKPSYWNKIFKSQSLYVQELVKGFQQFRVGKLSFNDVRDKVRLLLHNSKPLSFPNGHHFASVNELARVLLDSVFPPAWTSCPLCHRRQVCNINDSVHFYIQSGSGRSICEWVS